MSDDASGSASAEDLFNPFAELPDPATERAAPAGWGELERGRYIYPDPVTGERKSWQRVSNFVDTIEDSWALVPWEKRTILHGLTVREDLYVKACGLDIKKDKAALDEIVEQAKIAGGGEAGANIGTGLHGFFEQSDTGQPVRAPERYRHKVQLRAQALRGAQLTVVPELREVKVIIPKLGAAGRFDEVLRDEISGQLVVGDDKTENGKTLDEVPKFELYDYGHATLQLAMYANAEYMWDETTFTYRDMPDLNKDVGILIWSPKMVDHCEIKQLDIAEGWRMCLEVIPRVREFRNKGKRKGITYVPGCLIPSPTQVERDAVRILECETAEEMRELRDELKGSDLWSDELAGAFKARYWQLQKVSSQAS